VSIPPAPPYRGVDWDDALEKHANAAEITTKGYIRAERWLKIHAPSTVLSLAIVEGLHRMIFAGLFPDFAGRLRGPSPRYVATDVEFGNYHGTRHMEVPSACQELFRNVEALISQLEGIQGILPPDDFDQEVLKVAAYVHCELIRIHPFVNGNGRTARACLNYFA
jgi:fido (protein-threonine AMPylation protein)